jgi:hypothetical protein
MQSINFVIFSVIIEKRQNDPTRTQTCFSQGSAMTWMRATGRPIGLSYKTTKNASLQVKNKMQPNFLVTLIQ